MSAQVSLDHRLVHRATMGMTEFELRSIDSRGYQGYLAYHLDYELIDDFDLVRRLRPYTTLEMSAEELREQPGGLIINELIAATVLRAVYSRRQLFERMVSFWTDHFNIEILKGAVRYFKTVDDREVIRRHALGSFPELLRASARSPAMLFYLDNYTSSRGNPNENYARELMELHTLGVDNGYTQKDITEVARCFTGWTIELRGGPDWGTFRFDPARHDFDEKKVLGFTIPAGGGLVDGERVLQILTTEPRFARKTGEFVGRKMARWLFGYEPPDKLVRRVADTYVKTDGNIRAMVRTILQAKWLKRSDPKYKRPFHLMVAGLRSLGVEIQNIRSLMVVLRANGQIPFYWGTPDGYPDDLQSWVGLILPRWNFGSSLLNGELFGVTFNLAAFLKGARTAEEVADRIDNAMFGGEMDVDEKSAIREHMFPDPPSESRIRDAIGLSIASPGFQWY